MEKLREAITKMNMSARAYDRILNPNQSLGRRQVVFMVFYVITVLFWHLVADIVLS